MHVIEGARLKPGMTIENLPAAQPDTGALASPVIHGKALIFWDPKLAGTRYGRKLDAIDTDQITPAADCVSESLETLEYRASLAPEMDKLPERERKILFYRFYRGMTQSEIAERLGISQMHVSRLLARTLAQLRQALTTDD